MQVGKSGAMSKFDEITDRFADIKYMIAPQAVILRDLIKRQDARDILEIGFFQGKSSLYIAGALEDLGRGHLTTIDREQAKAHNPNIETLLGLTGLGHRVTPVYAYRSFTWELQKMIAQSPRPQFDLCYFDGGHTWDDTGFGFLLVDLLLKPGGLIVFDDLNWSVARSPAFAKDPARVATFSQDEAMARSVERVWDLLVPERGYEQVERFHKINWGVARKPVGSADLKRRTPTQVLRRLRSSLLSLRR